MLKWSLILALALAFQPALASKKKPIKSCLIPPPPSAELPSLIAQPKEEKTTVIIYVVPEKVDNTEPAIYRSVKEEYI